MNYSFIHNNIIDRAKSRNLKDYSEKHHVIPKCMGGTNDSENIVKLTAREHFLIHRLLCKIYPSNGKLKNALWRFIHGNKNQKIVSSKMYEKIKKECVPFWRAKSIEMMKDKDFRLKTIDKMHTPEVRKKAVKTMMKTIATNRHKQLRIESSKKSWRDHRELIPVLVFRAIQIQKPNHGKQAIWAKGDFICEYPYAEVASERTGVTATKICKVIQGIRKQSNGFIFERKQYE